MTHQEAINLLNNLIGMVEDSKGNDYDSAFKIAIKAIEKQIPKKPYEEYDGYADGNPVVDYFCPTCMEDMDCYNPKHWWKCGQAIDWSDTE